MAGAIFNLVMLEAVAPRIVNNVSYVTRINHESHFSWQAQDLMMLQGNLCCSGDVGVSLFVAGAAFRAMLGDSRSAKCCIFQYKLRLQDGTSKVSEAAGAR